MVRAGITHGRLRQAASDAAEKLTNKLNVRFKVDLAGMLTCQYVAKEEAPGINTKIQLDWKIKGQGVAHTYPRARNILHKGDVSIPKDGELPLIVACLPKAIEQHRLVAGMDDCTTIRVLGIGVPKHQESIPTCTVNVNGSEMEHYKCANVVGNTWIVTDKLKPEGLHVAEIMKYKGVTMFASSQEFNKIMAVAQWKAEVEKAVVFKKDVDYVAAMENMELNAFNWKRKATHVFVMWQGRKDSEVVWEISEVRISSLIRRR